MKIAFIGDVHGDLDRLAACAQAAAAAGAGTAIQLGDLGFREDLLGAGRPWPRFPIPVLAVDGNHEDHDFLAWAHASGLAAHWARHGLVHQPRGSLVRLGRCTVLFAGGALHADRPQEEGNPIADTDIATALAACAVRPPDLIASHSCPAGIGIGMSGSPAMAMLAAQHISGAGHDSGPADDCGEPALTRLWHGLPRKPTLWAFGHFHHSHEALVGRTRFLALPEGDPSAAVTLYDADGAVS